MDGKSYNNSFLKVSSEWLDLISTVWLVAPAIIDLAPPTIEFIEFPRTKCAKRSILLCARTSEKGGIAMGQIQAHLHSIDGIEYAVF
jgi:hypothetical protein